MKFWSLFLICFAGINTVFGQTTYQISGKIYNQNKEPIPGVTIVLHEWQLPTITNNLGQFNFKNIKPGNYHVDCYMLGYEAQSVHFTIPSDSFLLIELIASYIEIKEIVVEEDAIGSTSATRSQSVMAINKNYLFKHQNGNLIQTLDILPGVQSIKVSTGTAKPIIRGLGYNRVGTNLNGMRQETQQWGADHGLPISAQSIENIEIIKGPASLLYGSDAIGGVFNFKTEAIVPKSGIHGSVNLIGESNSQLTASALKISARKNSIYTVLGFSGSRFGDYKVPTSNFNYNGYILPIYQSLVKNTAGNSVGFNGVLGILKSWGFVKIWSTAYQQKIGFFPGAHGRPRFDLLQPDNNSFNIDMPNQFINHVNLGANSSIFISKKSKLDISIGLQTNQRKEFEEPHDHKPGPTPNGNLALGLKLNTLSGSVKLHTSSLNELKQVTGIQILTQQNHKLGFEYFLPNYQKSEIGIFYFAEKPISNKKTINAGVRLDGSEVNILPYSTLLYNNQNQIIGDTLLTPNMSKFFSNVSAAVGWVNQINKHQLIKYHVSTGFRFPTVPELAANGFHHGSFRFEVGNSNLLPERNVGFDIGWILQKQKFYLKLEPYANYFIGYLYLAPSGNFASKYYGGGHIHEYKQTNALHTGADFQVDYHFAEHWHTELVADVVFAHNIATNLPLPFIPPFRFRLETYYDFHIKHALYKIGVNTQGALAQNRVDRNELTTPAYIIVGAQFSATFLKSKNLQSFIRVDNLTNQKYFNHLSRFRIINLPEAGRNVVIGLYIKF